MSSEKIKTLEDNGIYLFNEDFNSKSCGNAIRFILEKNINSEINKLSRLMFIINSPGGFVSDCFALIDTMKGSMLPVHTVGLGLIASCGLNLFMAGEPGHRSLTPNTTILSHQFSSGAYGKEHELIASVKRFDLTQERILEHYKKCTGLSEKKIRKYLLPPHDVHLTADEAIELGIADRVVTTY